MCENKNTTNINEVTTQKNSHELVFFVGSCIYGDYKGKIISQKNKNCGELIGQNPQLCDDEFIRNLCCNTCGNSSVLCY